MAVQVEGNARALNASAKVTNPTAAGAALADSGPLSPGIYNVLVVVGASVPATFKVQHRNAGNTADIEVAVIYAPAATSIQIPLSMTMQAQAERVQVRPEADITGNAAVAMMVERVL